MNKFNDMQAVKRRFFAFRNGIIADTLRKGGSPFKIIFGLNRPQLCEIAESIGTDMQLAEDLWANTSTRESLLLAPMIYPVDKLSIDKAIELCRDVDNVEIADNLCHSLLRKSSLKNEIVTALFDSDKDMERYIALRLLFSLLHSKLEASVEVAERELARNCKLTKPVARQILDEVEFIKSASC